jgi:hypothetical protein
MTKKIFSQVLLSFKIILRMKTNVSGLNDAKFQVKIHLQSMICIITFAEMEFLILSHLEASIKNTNSAVS